MLVEGDICARIKEAREAAGLTQEQFGDLLNVTKRTIGYYEKAPVPWDQAPPARRQHGQLAALATSRGRLALRQRVVLLKEIRSKLDDLLTRLPPTDAEIAKAETEAEEQERADQSERSDDEPEEETPDQEGAPRPSVVAALLSASTTPRHASRIATSTSVAPPSTSPTKGLSMSEPSCTLRP